MEENLYQQVSDCWQTSVKEGAVFHSKAFQQRGHCDMISWKGAEGEISICLNSLQSPWV